MVCRSATGRADHHEREEERECPPAETHVLGSVGLVFLPPVRPVAPLVLVVALAIALPACGSAAKSAAQRAEPAVSSTTSEPRSTTTATSTSSSSTATTATVPPTVPPATSAPPTTTPAAFSGTVSTVTAADLASSYRAGCPVGPPALRRLRMSYWGFDNRPHVGAMVVNVAVTHPVLTVFATLFRAHFPLREMVTVDAFGGDDRQSMAADNTSAFNCRFVPDSNPPRWSAHAYGEAIDINTVENPYVTPAQVLPPAGNAYLDRANLRPGMTAPGAIVNQAFASVGWFWGGRWQSPDYQHFSKNGG